MTVSVAVSEDGKSVNLRVDGRFDFSVHNEFRKAYKDLALTNVTYIVDLSKTDYMDSSALGMLLLLKEYAETDASRVKITNANDDIREILFIASFDKLFMLE